MIKLREIAKANGITRQAAHQRMMRRRARAETEDEARVLAMSADPPGAREHPNGCLCRASCAARATGVPLSTVAKRMQRYSVSASEAAAMRPKRGRPRKPVELDEAARAVAPRARST